MNTNGLKKFAQAARIRLLDQVSSRLELILNTDSAELREKAVALNNLKQAINGSSKAQVIDKVAYTWFNRLMALRFMDANDYQPLGVRIVTPKDGFTLPEILEDTKQGQIPEELKINRQHIHDLLDGKIPSSNAQNEAYKELLIGACNHLHSIFPFLFERIDDYTELLLPDDLTSEFSIINDFVEGMQQEDCEEVEVIGWLYQFYISELNEELISSKNKYKKEDLAPASQLFTPKWIVQYMVDNTLGQLWKELNPATKVADSLEFYIKPAFKEPKRKIKSIEEIKFFEPCVGSGHILSYAFDVFYKMYEEQGYNPSEIPERIITKNLYGVDIDERAAQLASFVLLIKGRQRYRRFFRSIINNNIRPNISFYQDYEFDEKFNNATALGSLIKVKPEEAENYYVDNDSLFGARQQELKKLYKLLGERYDVVVTNPPYISSSRMDENLKKYVQNNFPSSKSDLFSTFILRCLELSNDDGFTGYMTPFNWMFISSFEELRKIIIENHLINNLVQLHKSGFDAATVFICTFTLRKNHFENVLSQFIRLDDFAGSKNQSIKTIEAIKNPASDWFYSSYQKDFLKIPGKPIGYWLTPSMISAFKNDLKFEELGVPRQGLGTTNNTRFVKGWFEVSRDCIKMDSANKLEAKTSGKKWFPYIKGGGFRRWYGNYNDVVNWKNDGEEIRNELKGKNPNIPRSEKLYFKKGITWGLISSFGFSCRKVDYRCIFDVGGSMAFPEEKDVLLLIAFLNSKITIEFLKVFSPTLNFQVGDLKKLPIKVSAEKLPLIEKLALECIGVSEMEWNSKENSWDFKKNEFFRMRGHNLEEISSEYTKFWDSKYHQLYQNENKLNQFFIELYGLEDELDPDIPFKDVTLLKDETSVERGTLIFNMFEVFAQFMSYAVGCMFGRYSLDKEGLILANQGETLEDYLTKVGESERELAYLPDEDNIIPVLDDEWFEDDIAGRFYDFLKASFGKEHFDKNLAFVEECLGKDVRKYFVKDFYKDHIKRYKKRPIYWMFSSPKGSFNVLIYMHRYTPDTLNQILNGYLVEYREKLKSRIEHLDHIIETGSSTEQTKAGKEKDKLKIVLLELQEYEREILYPLATERISIDLDDGVLVNYNKFGKAIQEVKGLNDKATKKKMRGFDWIDTETII